MRVAAVALVLIVGAAVVLAFANTLNSWVLGGLLGGLAAILLSIPISLALFTLLARRHDARQRADEESFADEPDFADDMYDESMVYEAEGYALPIDEAFSTELRARPLLENRRLPVSGYLRLPPAEQDLDDYEDDLEPFVRHEPRNYPLQPRTVARSLAQEDESLTPPSSTGSRRHPSTRSLAQHQSAALRQARQEAQRLSANRPGSGSLSRRDQGRSSARRSQTSRQLRPQTPTSSSRRPNDDYDTRRPGQQPARAGWREDEDFSEDLSTEQLRARTQQYPRQRGYPLNSRSSRARAIDPWTGTLEDEEYTNWDDEQRDGRMECYSRRDPERTSGTLRNPLVRRAPYLYEDDPMREEFAQQLDPDRPIIRRSSRYLRYEDESEY
jgi:hypothetical protein